MKIKTSELSGERLNWAVAVAVGLKPFVQKAHYGVPDRVFIEVERDPEVEGSLIGKRYKPSTDWSQGGPLIERFKVDIITERDCLVSAYANDDKYQPLTEDMYGSDHLIAACRAIVSSKLGDEVDVPEGLV